jgi:16S rRNA (guanine966-N2)-methyltransferase
MPARLRPFRATLVYTPPMRIISGQFGGRTILPPPSDTTRPITDRAKQSLFDSLCAPDRITDAVVLDCFSGTGSMGLECISRGARHVIFIERDRGALKALKENITALGIASACTVLPIDAYACLTNPLFSNEFKTLDIAFVDPPYAHMETGHLRHKADRLLATLAASHLSPHGLISLRHPTRVSVDPPALGVQVLREFHYGDMAITWLAKAIPQ